jgi:Uma2 family endonuclease
VKRDAVYVSWKAMNRPLDFKPEQAAPARFSVEEFMRMAELGAFDDMKVELDHGEIIRVTPPYSDHSLMQGQIIGKLYVALSETSFQVGSEVGVRLGPDTARVFDAGVMKPGVEPGRLLEPSEMLLGVEVAVASLAFDQGPKLRDYAAGGVPAYWIVDVKARLVHAYLDPAGGIYQSQYCVAFGEPLVVPGTDAAISIS